MLATFHRDSLFITNSTHTWPIQPFYQRNEKLVFRLDAPNTRTSVSPPMHFPRVSSVSAERLNGFNYSK